MAKRLHGLAMWAATFGAVIAPLPALAQDVGMGEVGPALDPGLMVGWANQGMLNATMNHTPMSSPSRTPAMGMGGGGLRLGAALRQPPSQAGASASLAYAATPALRQESVQSFIQRVRAKNPQYADVAQREFGKHDYTQIYHGIVAPFGLHENDTADAMASYFVLAWIVANGAPDPSPASVHGVRAQIAGALARDPRFSSPDGRARLGEEMKILFVTMHAGWQSARKEGNLPRYAAGVRQMFQQQAGIDLTALGLGNGFQPRG